MEPNENNRKILKISLLLFGIVVICSFGANTAAAANSTININGTSFQYDNGTIYIPDGVYNISNLNINQNVTIKGQSQNGTIINGRGNGPIGTVLSGVTVTLEDLTFTNATAINGGAINNQGTLILNNCTFINNTANQGGAIYNTGTLTVNGGTFTGNKVADFSSYGGAIYNKGTLTVANSTFNNNTATGTNTWGGAIYNTGGTLTIVSSTFNNNSAITYGGAICNFQGTLNATGSTFTGNKVEHDGGAIANGGTSYYSQATANITNSTFTNNSAYSVYGAGGAIWNGNPYYYNFGAIITVTYSTFVNNTAGWSGGFISTLEGNATLNYNRIVGSAKMIYVFASDYVNAKDNWWGTNNPNFSQLIEGTANTSSWLVLNITANPATIPNYGSSTVTANLLSYNGTSYTSVVNCVPIPITFTATNGSMNPTPTTLINGQTTSLFTANTVGTANITATVDNQMVTTQVIINNAIPTSLTVNSPSGYNGNTVNITATLTDTAHNVPVANKQVTITVNGQSNSGLTDSNGQLTWSFPISGMDAKDYTIQVSFAGDDQYASSIGTGTLTVNAIPTSLTVDPASGYKGDSTTLAAKLWDTTHNKAVAGMQVDFYVNGVKVGSGTTGNDGVATYAYTIAQDVEVYPNIISAVFTADNQYEGSNGASTLTVNAIPTSLIVDMASGYKGDDITLTARLWDIAYDKAVAGRQVDFYVNGILQGSGITDVNGYATWTYNIAQGVGTYLNYITTVFTADNQYAGSNGENTLTVSAIPTSLIVDPASGYKSDSTTLTATLWDTIHNKAVANKQVDFYVNGALVGSGTTNANGVATYDYTIAQDIGTYPGYITAVFTADNQYVASNGANTLTVNAIPTSLTVNSPSGYNGDTVSITATLTDTAHNVPVAGKNVTITVNGQSYTDYTDSNGQITWQFLINNMDAKDYTIQVSFAGDDQYASSSGTNTLTVNAIPTGLTVSPVSGYKGDSTTLTVTLTANGNPIAGKTVTFTVGSWSADATTNGSGVASVIYTIIQDVGNYPSLITAFFAGDTQYAGLGGANTLTVDTIPTNLTVNPVSGYKGDSANLTATLWDTIHNVAVSGKTISFYVNSVLVGSGITDGNGMATYTYTIAENVGIYLEYISAVFAAGDAQYNGSSGNNTLTVDAIPTSLTVDPVSGYKGDDTTLTAKLWDTAHNKAVVSKQVDFYVNGVKVGSGTTGNDGVATCVYTIAGDVGTYANIIGAIFSADTQYNGSSGNNTLTVNAIPTSLTVSNVTGDKGHLVDLKVTLWDTAHNKAFAGKTITFKVNGATVGSATTDINGVATLPYAIDLVGGNYTIGAEFAADNQYEGSSDNGTLKVPQANVYIQITPSKTNPTVGENIVITIKVGNKGPDAAQGVVVSYTVPNGFEFVNVTADAGITPVYDPTTRTMTWNLGNVPVGDPYMYITLKALSSGAFDNSAKIISETTYDSNIDDKASSMIINVQYPEQPSVPKVNAASKTTETIPLQHTGLPLAGFVLAILAVFSGLVMPKRK